MTCYYLAPYKGPTDDDVWWQEDRFRSGSRPISELLPISTAVCRCKLSRQSLDWRDCAFSFLCEREAAIESLWQHDQELFQIVLPWLERQEYDTRSVRGRDVLRMAESIQDDLDMLDEIAIQRYSADHHLKQAWTQWYRAQKHAHRWSYSGGYRECISVESYTPSRRMPQDLGIDAYVGLPGAIESLRCVLEGRLDELEDEWMSAETVTGESDTVAQRSDSPIYPYEVEEPE